MSETRSEIGRVRVDVWLWRARLAKTRAAAARLVAEGGVRLIRDGAAKRLDKPAAPVGPGDGLTFVRDGKVEAVRIAALGARRGPAAEARALYVAVEADPNLDIAGLA